MVVEVVQVESDSPVRRSVRVTWLDIEGKEAVERLCKTLKTRLSADFVNAPLDDAMKLLSNRTGISIRIEQKELEEACWRCYRQTIHMQLQRRHLANDFIDSHDEP